MTTDGAVTPPAARPRAGRILLWIGGAVIVAAALWTLRGQWADAMTVARSIRLSWGPVLLASALVLAAYLVLIATWRACVQDAGTQVGFGATARIWFVSNLARYIPGALWQMGALAVLTRQEGASATAATSAALVLTVINTLCGLAIAMAFGSTLPVAPQGVTWLPVVIGIAGLVGLRWFAPPLVQWIGRKTGKDIRLPALSARTVLAALLGSGVSWILYGVAFHCLVRGTVPEVALGFGAAIAIYSASYLAGFLSLGPPAGLGVADGAMVWLLTAGGIATVPQAAVIAAITRLWRTVLEILPGFVLLGVQRSRASRMP